MTVGSIPTLPLKAMRRLICFCKSKGDAASTRQRAFGLLEVARARGWQTDVLHVPAYPIWKLSPGRCSLFLEYWRALRTADSETVVVLQRPRKCRELFWLLSAMRRRIGYIVSDFDDAIWVHSPGDVKRILRLSDEVWCGSKMILDYMRSQGAAAVFVPTTIQTRAFARPLAEELVPVVGWVGDGAAHVANLQYLAKLLAEKSAAMPPFRLRLVGIRACRETVEQAFSFMRERVDLVDWVKPAEVPLIMASFSIGIMPLVANAFNAGKSGLKLIEYLAAGVPVMASDVGENRYIVWPPQHGFLATSAAEWQQCLGSLIENAALRRKMGAAGRAFVQEKYDRESIYSALLARLEHAIPNEQTAAGFL
jgi:glycosyltransferase involved in cell wall biosynthesis